MIRKLMVAGLVVAASLIAKADYWMTFCKTPGGRQYSQGTGRVGLRISLPYRCRTTTPSNAANVI